MKKLLALSLVFGILVLLMVGGFLYHLNTQLPSLITVEDYEPLLVSEVFDRKGEKIGEFFREKRVLIPYDQIPNHVILAFLAAEDDEFFKHSGINYKAIFRAFLANLRAGGKKVQGASTITMQAARTLLLSREKTYTRKIREVLLAKKMEVHLSKEDILYLYLNQIYFGHGAYGLQMASEIYFQKPVSKLTIPEGALLAGLPKAPTSYSPVHNPDRAKERQVYVINRMKDVQFIDEDTAQKAIETPLKVWHRKDYTNIAPHYLETIRQLLVQELGETTVLDKGIRIFTGLDKSLQLSAQQELRNGLHEVDKHQGFRGPKNNITEPEEIKSFLEKTRNEILNSQKEFRFIEYNKVEEQLPPFQILNLDSKANSPIPNYLKVGDTVEAIVTEVNDQWGYVMVQFAEGHGLIDHTTMKWARKPDPSVHFGWVELSRPSLALKKGDIIDVKITGEKFYSTEIQNKLNALKKRQGKNFKHPETLPPFHQYAEVQLEQKPDVEGSLLSFDLKSGEIIAMVGGYDFNESEFNRTIQAARQTGSAFKTLVYTSALDKGFTPVSRIIDSPIVHTEEIIEESEEGTEDEVVKRTWKPTNHSKKFGGDILFRNAIKRSLNVPTVKIVESVGVNWIADYAKRLGLFSPLNMDLTLGLGSSGTTLYEMLKAYSHIAKLGRRIRPLLISRVENNQGQVLIENLSLDRRFSKEILLIEEEYETKRLAYLETKNSLSSTENETALEPLNPDKPNHHKEPYLYFNDPNQLIHPTTAYIMTSLLHAVIHESGGTGGAARALGRDAAGKTGSSSDYYDAWFIGYTPQISTGVWVGFDEEKSLGRGEVGGRAALPIWLEFMKESHKNLPRSSFPVPQGIVFANIDNETGKLATARSSDVVKQPFLDGTEPSETNRMSEMEDTTNFYKRELSE